jgi:hypothetical protein
MKSRRQIETHEAPSSLQAHGCEEASNHRPGNSEGVRYKAWVILDADLQAEQHIKVNLQV